MRRQGSDAIGPTRVVVMGVSGSGKSTVGMALARKLEVEFVDGDSLHTPGNVEKMARGRSLTDEDRWPWLALVCSTLRSDEGIVVACSALARRHRDFLRQVDGVRFVFLDIGEQEAGRRLAQRGGHFMGPEMVVSQFVTLERPAIDEADVVTVDATQSVEDVVDYLRAGLSGTNSPGRHGPRG